MGAPHRHTTRAQIQTKLDEMREQIVQWYIVEKKPAVDIRELLREFGFDLSIGQVNFTIFKLGLKRPRETRNPRLLEALKNREHEPRPCTHCREEYVPKSGAQIFCDDCVVTNSDIRRIHNYGVNRPKLREMFTLQDNRCDICRKEVNEDTIAVDHNHVTGAVRGLLCRPCNLKLAVVEDADFTVRAQAYLLKHKQ